MTCVNLSMFLCNVGYTSIFYPFVTRVLVFLRVLDPYRPRHEGLDIHTSSHPKYRQMIDVITLYDVIWKRYASHKVYQVFDGTSSFFFCNLR